MSHWVALGFTALLVVATVATNKGRRTIMLLARFLLHVTLISAEDRIWRRVLNLPGPLPRNLGEVIDDPQRFEKLLRQNKALAADEDVLSILPLAAITTEPDKKATAGSIRVLIGKDGKQTRELKLFCKFQTGRGMPIWLQAIRAAAEPGVCREVDFYSQVSDSVPIKTLKPYLTLKYPSLNYVLVALEYVDLENGQARVVNDYKGATVSEVKKMVTEVAKMHAKFVDASEPEVSWIPARRGLEYAKFVESFTDKTEKVWSHKVWGALNKYFSERPVTLVHGDCRPGNMMFEGSDRDNVAGIIFADWEATNIAPLMWDLTYCTTLGWTARSRRKNFNDILDAYLESLATEASSAQAVVPTSEEARLDVALLTLVLGYVSRTVRVKKFWANQGNTQKDTVSWFVRMALAISDLDAASVSQALGVDKEDVVRIQEDGLREVREEKAITTKEEDWIDL